MNISDNGLALIKRFEGCSLKAYPDPATGGSPWTIGYGWTRPVDGVAVHPEMVISKQKAEQLLRCGIVSYEQILNRLIRVRTSQNQFDALVSLAWNIGTRAFSTSTLLQKLNGGDYQGAADQFLCWVHANGQVMPGLERRRRAERALFLTVS
ncbi:glycoside hydrolase family protein [Erwinia sp. CPCC 100877]|nr:glycoside hydrolase family protein [Erwinia sp. CPCC 100877]